MRTHPRTGMCLVVAALAASLGAFAAGVAADEQRLIIEIRGSQFEQEAGSLRPGDIVVWQNQDIVPHTATARDASWDSGLIPAGGQWQMVISNETTSDYYCTFHPSMVAALDISAQ